MISIPAGTHGKIYVRVSTQHQADDELPIESQVAELTAAVRAAGATADVVADAGISGTDLEGRPGLQSIASAARDANPGFTWVLVWKFSRFARNMEDGLVYRALLRKRGIELLSYKEPVPEGPLGTLITQILMAIDEFYAAATAADVLRSQKELARQGYSSGGRPPVGYRRAPEVIGTRYGGAPLTRVRWEPDPEVAPRVVRAFEMAAEGATYDEIVGATHICSNKSSLATILANQIYRGVRVFNRETRVEGEHGRKRRRNAVEEHVTSAVEPLIGETVFDRVQKRLLLSRENRLPPQRYAGGYVLSDVLRCHCGGKMAGHSAGPRRYYRCTAKPKCGRSVVPAPDLEAGVMDLVRREVLTEETVRSIVDAINSSIESRASTRGSSLAVGKAEVRRLAGAEANLRQALRQARGSAMVSLVAELDDVAAELRDAQERLVVASQIEKPLVMSDQLVRESLAQLKGILETATFAERVAWIGSEFDYINVLSDHAEAHWRAASETVSPSNDVGVWLRR